MPGANNQKIKKSRRNPDGPDMRTPKRGYTLLLRRHQPTVRARAPHTNKVMLPGSGILATRNPMTLPSYVGLLLGLEVCRLLELLFQLPPRKKDIA